MGTIRIGLGTVLFVLALPSMGQSQNVAGGQSGYDESIEAPGGINGRNISKGWHSSQP